MSSLSTDSTIVASTPKSQSITSNSHVEVTPINSYYNSNPFHSPKGPNGELPSNSVDYDFNINAIKTLLMTSKVPESCVWNVNEWRYNRVTFPFVKLLFVVKIFIPSLFSNRLKFKTDTRIKKRSIKVVPTITFPHPFTPVRCHFGLLFSSDLSPFFIQSRFWFIGTLEIKR